MKYFGEATDDKYGYQLQDAGNTCLVAYHLFSTMSGGGRKNYGKCLFTCGGNAANFMK